jgi:hypothetical protein
MILDGLTTFTGTSQGASGAPASGPQTDSPTTGTQHSSNVIDLGVTSGVPSSANGGGARDIGTGDNPQLKLSAIVTTAFSGGTGLTIQLSGAPDNGSGAAGSWTPMWTSEEMLEAVLIAGAQIANVGVPRPIFEQVLPRFLRLDYISDGTHSAGALEAQIVIDRDDQVIGASGAQSGYPAGITVAN